MGKTLLALTAKLTADTTKFKGGLDKGKRELKGFSSSVGKLGGMIAGAFAVKAVLGFAKASAEAYDIQAKSEAALLTALGGRKDIQQDIIQQAGELQKRTLFGDEQSINAASRLAQVLGDDKEAIQQLLPLVADFATAKKMDMAQAAELIAKTVGSSTNALSRYGVSIEGAVGSSERLASATNALNDMVGGQAEAAAGVGTGSVTQLSNAWGDLKEEIGELTMFIVDEAAPALTGLVTGLSEIASTNNKILKDDSISFWTKINGIFGGIGGKTHALAEIYLNELVVAEEAAEEATENQTEAVVEQIPILQKLADEIKEVTTLRDGSLSAATIAKHNDHLEALKEELKYYQNLTGDDLNRSKAPDKLEAIGTGKIKGAELDMEAIELSEQLKLNEREIDEYIKQIEIVENKTLELSETVQSAMGSMVSSFAEDIGHLISGVGSFDNILTGIGQMFGDFLVNMGESIVAYGISMLAFEEALSNPIGAIVAGAALVVAGTLVRDMASSGPEKMATGGYVPPGYPNDTYPALLSSGEKVTPAIPLSAGDRQAMQPVILDTRISGDDLYLVMKRNNQHRARIS